ncbi:MAG: hypothetical protein KDC10_04950 [Calditrichaeota bacterium]|nr:hypothetical protein [Calditrichota bacterium]
MKTLATALVILFAALATNAAVIRVPKDQPTIQAAIDFSQTSDSVLVSPGVYTGLGNRDIVIQNKSIYLVGSTNSRITVIDCENLAGGIQVGPNANATHISGVTIRNGSRFNGGGIIATSSCNVTNCRIHDCIATDGSNGGGIYASYTSLTITKCVIYNCSADNGGGVFHHVPTHESQNPWYDIEVSRSTICNNTGRLVNTVGGVKFDYASILHEHSNIFWGNTGTEGTVSSSQIWGNGPNYHGWSDIQGWTSGVNGLINEDPQFLLETEGDFRLASTSPCIDAGQTGLLDPDGAQIEMGAEQYCESSSLAFTTPELITTEPGQGADFQLDLWATCRLVDVDSLTISGSSFYLSSGLSVVQPMVSNYVGLVFAPIVQGVHRDTLHVWADTDSSNTDNPRHHTIPLVGEAGPIPLPVMDLSISILPDDSARLEWSPVTETIYGNPVVPDYYLIFYNELDPQVEAYWYYQGATETPGYTHFLVTRFRSLMSYRVVAWKGINPGLLGFLPGDPINRLYDLSTQHN